MSNHTNIFANVNNKHLTYSLKHQEILSEGKKLNQNHLYQHKLTIQELSDEDIRHFIDTKDKFDSSTHEQKLQLAMNLFYSNDPLKHPRIYQYIFNPASSDNESIKKLIVKIQTFVKNDITFNKVNTIFKDQKQFERNIFGETAKALSYLNTDKDLFTSLTGDNIDKVKDSIERLFDDIKELTKQSKDINNISYNKSVWHNQLFFNYFYNTCSDAGAFTASIHPEGEAAGLTNIGYLAAFGVAAGVGFAINMEATRKAGEILLHEIGLIKHLLLHTLEKIANNDCNNSLNNLIFTPSQIKALEEFLDIKRGSFSENLLTHTTNSRKYFNTMIKHKLAIADSIIHHNTKPLKEEHQEVNKDKIEASKSRHESNRSIIKQENNLITVTSSCDIEDYITSALKHKKLDELTNYITALTPNSKNKIANITINLEGIYRGNLLGYILRYDHSLETDPNYQRLKEQLADIYQKQDEKILITGFGKTSLNKYHDENRLITLHDILNCDYLDFSTLIRQYRATDKEGFLNDMAHILLAITSNSNLNQAQKECLRTYFLQQLNCKGEGNLSKIRQKQKVLAQNLLLGEIAYEGGLNLKRNITLAAHLDTATTSGFIEATAAGAAGWALFSTLAPLAGFFARGNTTTYKQASLLLNIDINSEYIKILNIKEQKVVQEDINVKEDNNSEASMHSRLSQTKQISNKAYSGIMDDQMEIYNEEFSVIDGRSNISQNPERSENNVPELASLSKKELTEEIEEEIEINDQPKTTITINELKSELKSLLTMANTADTLDKLNKLIIKYNELEPNIIYAMLSDSDNGKDFLFHRLQKKIHLLEKNLGSELTSNLYQLVAKLWQKCVKAQCNIKDDSDDKHIRQVFLNKLQNKSFNHAREALLEYYEILAIISTSKTDKLKKEMLQYLATTIIKARYDPTSKWYNLLKRCAADELALRMFIRGIFAILWAAGSAVVISTSGLATPVIAAIVVVINTFRGLGYGLANIVAYQTFIKSEAYNTALNELQTLKLINDSEDSLANTLNASITQILAQDSNDVSYPKLNVIREAVKQFANSQTHNFNITSNKKEFENLEDFFNAVEENESTIFDVEDENYITNIKSMKASTNQDIDNISKAVSAMIIAITPPITAGKYAQNQAFYRILRNIWLSVSNKKIRMAMLMSLFVMFHNRELAIAMSLSVDRNVATRNNYFIPHMAFGALAASTSVAGMFPIFNGLTTMFIGGTGDYLGGLILAIGLNTYDGFENTKSFRNGLSVIKDLLYILHGEIQYEENVEEERMEEESKINLTLETFTKIYNQIMEKLSGRNIITRLGTTSHSNYPEKHLSTMDKDKSENI